MEPQPNKYLNKGCQYTKQATHQRNYQQNLEEHKREMPNFRFARHVFTDNKLAPYNYKWPSIFCPNFLHIALPTRTNTSEHTRCYELAAIRCMIFDHEAKFVQFIYLFILLYAPPLKYQITKQN